ncbi:MAG TPA: DUF4013 domain-containing protein [Thermoanaerobaculia bacterium]|nr:DUF4013 domain-containing protein [Thermoanaerobaculia bacterium]
MSDMQYVPPPPPAVPPPPPSPEPAFDFAKPFTFVFDDPRWMPKILIGGLFYLAGMLIVGWFFILGYLAQMVRNVIRGDANPLPEWENNLGDFFNEGLRLVGVVLCWMVPILALVIAFILPMAVFGSADSDELNAFGGGIAGCMACLIVPLSLGITFFMPASLTFAVVEQRFGAAFELRRIWPYIKANIGNYLLAIVVYLIARMLGGIGVMLLCVGVFFTAFWAFLITAHSFAQVYRLAITRPAS